MQERGEPPRDCQTLDGEWLLDRFKAMDGPLYSGRPWEMFTHTYRQGDGDWRFARASVCVDCGLGPCGRRSRVQTQTGAGPGRFRSEMVTDEKLGRPGGGLLPSALARVKNSMYTGCRDKKGIKLKTTLRAL